MPETEHDPVTVAVAVKSVPDLTVPGTARFVVVFAVPRIVLVVLGGTVLVVEDGGAVVAVELLSAEEFATFQ